MLIRTNSIPPGLNGPNGDGVRLEAEAFPPALETLREDAVRLTQLYIISAYSKTELEDKDLDALRKFWRTFNTVRRTALR